MWGPSRAPAYFTRRSWNRLKTPLRNQVHTTAELQDMSQVPQSHLHPCPRFQVRPGCWVVHEQPWFQNHLGNHGARKKTRHEELWPWTLQVSKTHVACSKGSGLVTNRKLSEIQSHPYVRICVPLVRTAHHTWNCVTNKDSTPGNRTSISVDWCSRMYLHFDTYTYWSYLTDDGPMMEAPATCRSKDLARLTCGQWVTFMQATQ